MRPAPYIGDDLLRLLGVNVEEPRARRLLVDLAHGVLPELDPDDPDDIFDWVTVKDIGLEFGFVDQAYFKASDESLRRTAPLVLFQLYFYGDTPTTRPFPYPLPFDLSFADDRAAVHRKLDQYESTRRSYIRDSWRLPDFDVTVGYYRTTGLLESIYCHVPLAPWPVSEPPVSCAELVALFGRRWSDPDFRDRLAVLDVNHKIPEIRSDHEADFRRAFGFELMFAEARLLEQADKRSPQSLVFSGVTFYSSRDLDARQWSGTLPFGLTFDDTQQQVLDKVRAVPEKHSDQTLIGFARWRLPEFTLSVMYSNVENRVLRVTVEAPRPDAAEES